MLSAKLQLRDEKYFPVNSTHNQLDAPNQLATQLRKMSRKQNHVSVKLPSLIAAALESLPVLFAGQLAFNDIAPGAPKCACSAKHTAGLEKGLRNPSMVAIGANSKGAQNAC